MSMLCLTVVAETPDFDLDMGDGYIYFRDGDDLSKAEKITGISTKELQKLFKQENLVMLALSEDNQRQIRVAHYSNELSEKIADLDLLDIKQLAEFRDKLSERLSLDGTLIGTDYVENLDAPINKYVIHTELFSDNGGDYMVTQYVTVKDGAFWHITTYGPNHSNVPDVVPHFSVDDGGIDMSKVFYAVGALFAVLAVMMLILYIKEHRTENSVQNFENQ